MHGTHRRASSSDRAYAVSLVVGGWPVQAVTNMTGINADTLRAAAKVVVAPKPTEGSILLLAAPEPAKAIALPSPEALRPGRAEIALRYVCAKYQLTMAGLRGRRVTRGLYIARQEAMYRLHEEMGLSTTVAGRLLGGRDHTTIIHGVNRHAARLAWIDFLTGAVPR